MWAIYYLVKATNGGLMYKECDDEGTGSSSHSINSKAIIIRVTITTFVLSFYATSANQTTRTKQNKQIQHPPTTKTTKPNKPNGTEQ